MLSKTTKVVQNAKMQPSMDLRYPVGEFQWPEDLTGSETRALMEQIEAAPANLRAAVAGLSEDQLDTPYRPGGWTVRQVVHHIFDSHLNSYVRMKLALTEDEPNIKPYDQERWAQLADSREPVEVSLRLIEGLHHRWIALMRSLSQKELQKNFVHPEIGKVRLDKNIALYAWHGRHHVGHILGLRERMGW